MDKILDSEMKKICIAYLLGLIDIRKTEIDYRNILFKDRYHVEISLIEECRKFLNENLKGVK